MGVCTWISWKTPQCSAFGVHRLSSHCRGRCRFNCYYYECLGITVFTSVRRFFDTSALIDDGNFCRTDIKFGTVRGRGNGTRYLRCESVTASQYIGYTVDIPPILADRCISTDRGRWEVFRTRKRKKKGI